MAAGSTYSQIATTTLGSATASYTFSSIPQTYTNLVIIINASNTAGNNDYRFRLNGDTGTNYSYTQIQGDGSSVSSGRASNITSGVLGTGSTSTAGADTNIMNVNAYSNTTTYKSVLNRLSIGTGTGSRAQASISLWRSTAAINSVTILTTGGTFASGSTFTLYGIRGA